MSDAVLSALITGGQALIGVVISNLATAHKTETVLKVNQAVTDARLQNLTDEVRRHNNFAVEIPVIKEQIKVINHRIGDLEKGGAKYD